MYSRFITSQAVKILVCPVDQQRHRQAERQLPPALPPVAARNLSGNNPIDFKTFLFSGPLIQGSAWRLGRSLNLRRAMLTSLHRRPRGKKFAEVLRGFDDEMDILDKDQWTKRAVKELSRLQHTLGRSFTCFSLCHSFHSRALVLNILNMSLTLCSLQPF